MVAPHPGLHRRPMRTCLPSASRHLDPVTAFPIGRFRRARFRDGIVCPRCGHTDVHRWGSFGWRRRYRCLGCRRTFSDFTGTPLAYLKRVELWESYCTLALRTATIRQSARRLGVDPSTAFRWRHRLLATLRDTERGRLSGRISVDMTWLPHSDKGTRGLARPARRVAYTGMSWETRIAWVLAACDDSGRAIGAYTGAARPRLPTVIALLQQRAGDGTSLLGRSSLWGLLARAAGRLGLAFEREFYVPLRARDAADPEQARVYLLRWKKWLTRFRGIATKYIDHYLAWFRLLDRVAGRPGGPLEADRLLLLGRFP